MKGAAVYNWQPFLFYTKRSCHSICPKIYFKICLVLGKTLFSRWNSYLLTTKFDNYEKVLHGSIAVTMCYCMHLYAFSPKPGSNKHLFR